MEELTVALPLYRAKYIGWLALESLCNQITEGFPWELVVAEETDERYLPFGYDNIMGYENRLKNNGCIKIEYIALDKWIPLAQKWMLIRDNSSANSKIFVLQAADCYSGKSRLQNTYNIYKRHNPDWIQYTKHLMYDLHSSNFYMLDINSVKAPIGADMAISLELLKKVKPSNKKRRVDRWLYESCKASKKNSKLFAFNDQSSKWKDSLNVHGLNNISNRQSKINNNIYTRVNNRIKQRFPDYIIKKLSECKQLALDWNRII